MAIYKSDLTSGDLLDLVFEKLDGFKAFIELCEKILGKNVLWNDETQSFDLEEG